MRLLILLGFAFWMVACTPSGKQTSSKEALSSDSIQYAQGFTVQRFDTYIMVEVRDPWDSTRLLQRYLLVDRTKSVPGGLPKGTIVKVPVKDIVIYTSVHAAIIDQLHETDKVIGVCEPRYMDTPAIQEGIQAGRIADLGEATSPNIEKMIEIGAELVIASPFQNSSYGPVEKIGILSKEPTIWRHFLWGARSGFAFMVCYSERKRWPILYLKKQSKPICL
mgnify:CR=1 FL=1